MPERQATPVAIAAAQLNRNGGYGRAPSGCGNGAAVRDYVYVADLARANVPAGETPMEAGGRFARFGAVPSGISNAPLDAEWYRPESGPFPVLHMLRVRAAAPTTIHR